MKISKYAFVFVLLASTTLSAASLDKLLGGSSDTKINIKASNLDIDKTIKNAIKSTQDEVIGRLDAEVKKLQENLNKSVSNITDKFDAEIKKATDRVNNNIIGKAENLVNDAQKQYDSLVKTKDNILSTIENLMNNLPTYLMILKIVGAVLVAGIVLLVFFFWRSYRNVKNLAKSVLSLGDVKGLDSIITRLDKIEAKLDKLLSK